MKATCTINFFYFEFYLNVVSRLTDVCIFCISGLPKETFLIPNEENQAPSTEETYNFITECFFLTHQCIHMSFHAVHEKFLKLNQELHRVQRLYNEVRGQGNDEVEPVRSIKKQMEKGK